MQDERRGFEENHAKLVDAFQAKSRAYQKYYKMYGLALRGLVRHHDIDPMDFDIKLVCYLDCSELCTKYSF